MFFISCFTDQSLPTSPPTIVGRLASFLFYGHWLQRDGAGMEWKSTLRRTRFVFGQRLLRVSLKQYVPEVVPEMGIRVLLSTPLVRQVKYYKPTPVILYTVKKPFILFSKREDGIHTCMYIIYMHAQTELQAFALWHIGQTRLLAWFLY